MTRSSKRPPLPSVVPDRVTLTCECCGCVGTFASLEDAFALDWDTPDRLGSWPVTCGACLGSLLIIGGPDLEAHRRTHRG